MRNVLTNLIATKNQPESVGVYSACSANPYVIEAVLQRGKEDGSCVLIESTANQCDQFGGYTGMTPLDFKKFVHTLCDKTGFDKQALFLGGDHLGPLTWAHHNEKKAMELATELVRQYVHAGFTKIHIDTSMKVADDPADIRLTDAVIARRGAKLVRVAQQAYEALQKNDSNAVPPVYIVGSEVPVPGGAVGNVDDGVQVTTVQDFQNTVAAFQQAFLEEGIMEVWAQVIAVVVQPGVEEKDSGCTDYSRANAAMLMQSIAQCPSLVFEGHSTDYQTRTKLREMVEDGVKILKVGPGLTFAMREALFALSYIEDEVVQLSGQTHSRFREVLDHAMLENPTYWSKHYKGTECEVAYKRKFSFSDRARYYMPTAQVTQAMQKMIENLREFGIPLGLLSQFMPIQYAQVREGMLENNPDALIISRIINTIDEYLYATHQHDLLRE